MEHVKIVRIIGGTRHELEVPIARARELGLATPAPAGITVPYLMEGIFSVGVSQDAPTSQCDTCGTTVRDLVLRRRVGCAACYDTFRDTIDRLLDQRRPADGFRGRIPQRLQRYRRLFVDRAALLQQLSVAVDAEDFETAAQLRDQVQRFDLGESLPE